MKPRRKTQTALAVLSNASPPGDLRRRFYWLALYLLLAAAMPAGLQAQVVAGEVTDPQGVPVQGVLVEISDAAGQVWRVRTDAWGRYQIAGLGAGRYRLRALCDDFEVVEREIEVAALDSVQADVQFVAVRSNVTSIEVIGESAETLREIPGSVYLVSKEELLHSRPMDANEALRRVPGVNLREDSGPVALRLNIGLRGLNPDRSRRVLMLEDGIPISLAPYGEPEMYYSPPIDRMKRVEVLKGSGQIMYGPQTVGGVMNFVTPDPPSSTRAEFDLEGGQRGFFTGQGSLGGSNREQSAGWFLNFLRKQGDGFRNFYFNLNDLQSKFTLKVGERHNFAFKLGLYDEWSNSTYLGLTTPQFREDPKQNVVPSDRLEVQRSSTSVSHSVALSPTALVNTSFFAYCTRRNWRRQDFDRSDKGKDYLAIAGDPSLPGGAVFLLDSTGNRNREFLVTGIQSNLAYEHRLGGLRNKLDAGIRYLYEAADDKRINGERFDASTGILRDDEDRFGKAFSLFVQNRFFLTDKLVLTPGFRLEQYRYERHILRQRVNGIPTDVDIRKKDSLVQAVPGLGISYQVHEFLTVFGGVHRGFAPPRTKDAISRDGESLDLDAELSWNYEVGVRFGPHRAVRGEVTYFRLDFENQIIPGAESGGATTTLVNAGETLNQGIESSVRVNWDQLFHSPLVVYTDIRHMYLPTATFTRNALFAGNRLPYAPETTFSFLVGVRQRNGFGVQFEATYVGDQFGDNNATVTPSADGTIGLLPSYTLLSLGVDYTFQRERYQVQPYVVIKNLADKVYISSRAPEGIQPGLFRQVNAGVRFIF